MGRKKRHRVKKKVSLFALLTSRRFWFSLFSLLLAGGSFYLLFLAPFFQVERVEIEGARKVKARRVKSLLEEKLKKEVKVGPFVLFRSESTFLFSPGVAARAIEKRFLQVGEAKVGRILPDKIGVEIEERRPLAEVCEKRGGCFRVDQEGVAFEKSASVKKEDEAQVFQIKKEDLTLTLEGKSVKLGEKILPPLYLEEAKKIQERTKSGFEVKAETFVLSEKQYLVVRCEKGFAIYFNLEADVGEQLSNLDLVLREKIPEEEREGLEYIDLRFGNRVYYK